MVKDKAWVGLLFGAIVILIVINFILLNAMEKIQRGIRDDIDDLWLNQGFIVDRVDELNDRVVEEGVIVHSVWEELDYKVRGLDRVLSGFNETCVQETRFYTFLENYTLVSPICENFCKGKSGCSMDCLRSNGVVKEITVCDMVTLSKRKQYDLPQSVKVGVFP